MAKYTHFIRHSQVNLTLDVFNKINLKILLNDDELASKNKYIRTILENDIYQSTLQVSNKILHDNKYGSIIDIDTFLDDQLDNFFSNTEPLINDGHLIEKTIFFDLLTNAFISSLNPEY